MPSYFLVALPQESNETRTLGITFAADQFANFYTTPNIFKTMSATATTPFFDSIHTALVSSPYVPTKKVNFEADRGHVVLKGHVSSFFQKQMAQEAILRVDGVQRIENRLEVRWG